MRAYSLTISSPDGHLFKGDAVKLIVRGVEGELAVLAGHIPYVTAVKACDCRIEFPDGTERVGHTDGGILSVTGESVTLLSGSFQWKE